MLSSQCVCGVQVFDVLYSFVYDTNRNFPTFRKCLVCFYGFVGWFDFGSFFFLSRENPNEIAGETDFLPLNFLFNWKRKCFYLLPSFLLLLTLFGVLRHKVFNDTEIFAFSNFFPPPDLFIHSVNLLIVGQNIVVVYFSNFFYEKRFVIISISSSVYTLGRGSDITRNETKRTTES